MRRANSMPNGKHWSMIPGLRVDVAKNSWDHRRIIDAGGRQPKLMGVGKRRWYATIFSFERPRSRSMSTQRPCGSLSRAGLTPRSSFSSHLPCQPRVFTQSSPVFIPAVLPSFTSIRRCLEQHASPLWRTYLSSLTGMRRLPPSPRRRVLTEEVAEISTRSEARTLPSHGAFNRPVFTVGAGRYRC